MNKTFLRKWSEVNQLLGNMQRICTEMTSLAEREIEINKEIGLLMNDMLDIYEKGYYGKEVHRPHKDNS